MRFSRALASITFDDGRLSALTLGAEILEKYGLHGTFYPITDVIGTENEHGKYATWNDLTRAARAGHEIGNHTHTHARDLHTWEPDRQRADITKANELLTNHGLDVRTFAYPYGLYSKQLTRTLGEIGFQAARTIDAGVNMDSNLLHLQSLMLVKRQTVADISREMENALAERGWLILTFHHIDNTTDISTPPHVFETMIQTIVQSGITIVPVRDGVKFLIQ